MQHHFDPVNLPPTPAPPRRKAGGHKRKAGGHKRHVNNKGPKVKRAKRAAKGRRKRRS